MADETNAVQPVAPTTTVIPPSQVVQRPDLAALADEPAVSGDIADEDLADADELPAPAPVPKPLPVTGPFTAFATIVRDSAGRTVAVCGASHMNVEARHALATIIAEKLNG